MTLDMKVFLARFAEEAAKHCLQLEKNFLALEAEGLSAERLDAVFRTAHTLKGAARMMKLPPIAEAAHGVEDVLERLRSGEERLSQALVDGLLTTVDRVRHMVALVAAGTPLPATMTAAVAPDTQREVLPSASGETDRAAVVGAEGGSATEFVQIRADRLDELIRLMGEMVSLQHRKKQQAAFVRDLRRLAANCQELACGQTAAVETPAMEPGPLVNTLTLLQSQLRAFQDGLRDDAVLETMLAAELQERSLQIRMLPLSTVFDKLNRAVRDLARTTGKDIEFQIEGGDTELDRKIIERLGDSLLHMIRNAVDHGMEYPEERIKAGKPSRGLICLKAAYDTGGVSLVLRDDGIGILPEKIKQEAIKRQLLDEAAAEQLTTMELQELIFLPGFSTSPLITDLSGRGVGMNAVRQTIVEELKGTVSIRSRAGEGTSFVLNVPITLALSRMLMVVAAQQTFALPAYPVEEIIAVPADQTILVVGKRALRVREHLVPLEELAQLLCCPQAQQWERREMLVVVLAIGTERLGLIVDAVLSEADMVVRALPAAVRHLPVLSGFTVGTRDEIISVLGVAALLRQAREGKPVVSAAAATVPAEQKKSILVVDDSANTRDIVQSILEAYGYRVDLAEDGMVAITKTDRTVYDAVITDVEMPYLDGFSLTAHLRQDERYRQIPVIIVTSREKDEDKRRGIQVGANAYIVKGAFDQNNLLETVRSLIG
ncbi:MAG TPA: response regulator [Patescibacteria group bacterium]|nr:response regulator [Patescibacteria group bacterium]